MLTRVSNSYSLVGHQRNRSKQLSSKSGRTDSYLVCSGRKRKVEKLPNLSSVEAESFLPVAEFSTSTCAATINAFWTSLTVPVKRPAVWVWANTPINEAKRIQILMTARMTWHFLPRVHPLLPDLGFLVPNNVSAPNWPTVTSGAPPGALDSRIADQSEAVPTSDPL